MTREHGQDGGNEPLSSGGGTQFGGVSRQTATKAIMVGSLLMSSARAMEKDVTESNDMTPVLVTGAILMALGVVYAGQLVYEVSQCCLKRLRAPRDGDCHDEGGDIVVVSEDEGNVMFTSTSLQRLGSKERTGRKAGAASTTSLNMTSQSGKGASATRRVDQLLGLHPFLLRHHRAHVQLWHLHPCPLRHHRALMLQVGL